MPERPWVLAMDVARHWALTTWLTGEAEGSTLVDALGRSGVMSNTIIADDLLRWMVTQQWLKPLRFEPSFEQKFFGMGGRLYRGVKNPEWDQNTYPQAWVYEVNVYSVGYRDYVAEANPMQALLVWQPNEAENDGNERQGPTHR